MATRTNKCKKNNRIVLIKKANDLIESRYKFDIWETRIFLSVLSQIRKDDREFHVYRIRYRDVIKQFGLKSGDSYAYLRDGAKNLMEKKFVVNYEEKGVGREKLYHILRSVDVMQDGEQGKQGAVSNEYIDVVVEDMMRPLLLQLQKNFTAYDLENVKELGVYPIRVYELLKQYQKIGHRKLDVLEMKRMFEVENKYRMFGDFNRWVIRPAVRDINKSTDLLVTDTEKIKAGRKVVALRFSFRKKTEIELAEMRGEDISQLSLDLAVDNVRVDQSTTGNAVLGRVILSAPLSETSPSGNVPADNDSLVSEPDLELVVVKTAKDELFDRYHRDVIERFGVTPSVFLHLLDDHSPEAIDQAIRVTNRAKYNQQINKSVAGFFVQALRNGFLDDKESKMQRANRKAALADLKARKKAAINEKIREITERDKKIAGKAVKQLRADSITKIFITTKEETLGRKLTLEDFRQDRALVDVVKAKIMELASDEFAEMLDGYAREERKLKG